MEGTTTKPKTSLDHDRNRTKVCAPCGRKISVKEIRQVNKRETDLIVNFVNPNYNVDDPVFPNGLCSTCSV